MADVIGVESHEQDIDGCEATLGRRRFLRQLGLAVGAGGAAWLQTVGFAQAAAAGVLKPSSKIVRRGYDFTRTISAHQLIEIPQELLGDDIKPFRKVVAFKGARLSHSVGDADTIMERLDDAVIGKPIRTRLAAFGNVTEAPIELVGRGPLAGRYDIFVTLSPTKSSTGTMTLFSDDGTFGTFVSEITLVPLIEMRPVDGRESLFVDTGVTPIPGFPMRLGSSGGVWSTTPTSAKDVVLPGRGQQLFYPAGITIVTQSQSSESQESSDGSLDPIGTVKQVLKCDKVQAVFDTVSAAAPRP